MNPTVFHFWYLKESPQFHELALVHFDYVTDATTLTTARFQFQLTTNL